MALFIGTCFAPVTKAEASTKVGTPTLKIKNTEVGVGLKITWKKVSGADGYAVYMSTTKTGGYKRVDTTTKASYTADELKKNKNYYFKVRAYKVIDEKNVYGNYSKVVSGKTSKYPLCQVIDEGGQEVYFYWLWDGKTAAKDENYWKAWEECLDILAERYKNVKKEKWVGSSKNDDTIKDKVNGKIVCLSTPHTQVGKK